MKIHILAVGNRMPAWVDAAYNDFARRLPREMPLVLQEIKPESRNSGKTVATMLANEATRLRAALPTRCRKVILDERGKDLTTQALTQRLEQWQASGEDIAILIGGPDGLADDLKQEADENLRLSSLTLPHPLVRVVLAEALYRASSLLKGHPYHRA